MTKYPSDLRSIAVALGGDVVGRQVLAPGPGHSPRDRSLSVAITADGFVAHSHCGDDWRVCRDYVCRRLGLPTFAPHAEPRPIAQKPRPAPAHDDRQHTELASAIWREARPINGTVAEVYLRNRGLSYQGDALRWHPACPFGKGTTHGCMIAQVRNILTNQPQAVHRTAIDHTGHKVDRKALGPIGGGAVKLTPDEHVEQVLAIGEGIESTLSVNKHPDLVAMPVWSVLNSGGIASFPTLPGIEGLFVAVDHDRLGAGPRAFKALADRLRPAGVEVTPVMSAVVGEDINDLVKRHV